MMDANDRDDRRLRDDDRVTRSAASGSNGISPALIALVLVAAVAVVFVFQNRERRQIDFLFFEVTTRVWTSLAFAVLLGIVLDRLFSMWWRRRRRN